MPIWEIITSGSNADLNQVTASFFKGDGSAITGIISSSYAISASWAPFAVSASYVAGTYHAEHTQATASATWSFQHNLGQRHPVITVWDNLHYVIIPTEIFGVSIDLSELRFSRNVAGYAVATNGNVIPSTAVTASWAISASWAPPVPSDSASFAQTSISASYALSASYAIETDPIFVGKSGSFATTGSNTFTGDQTVNGIFIVSGGLRADNNFVAIIAQLSSSLIPAFPFDIGSITNAWNNIYSTGSIYIGGIPVLRHIAPNQQQLLITSASITGAAVTDNGVFVVGDFQSLPAAISGGIIKSGSKFFLGI